MKGFVSFVSAGPGDPELLTLKGANRLHSADVILYDDLASGRILDHARQGAKLIYVGKRAGKPSTKQKHITQLLLQHATPGVCVVRLKSGDVGIFGRLEEEIEALTSAGIDFEIIPGVTAGCAAAAAARIPLTRRYHSRRIQFITGSDVTGSLPQDINWPALVDPLASTVVYMGQRTFPKLAQELIDRGLPGETPAIFAETIGHPDQVVVRTTVKDLAAKLASKPNGKTAVILFGPLAASSETAT